MPRPMSASMAGFGFPVPPVVQKGVFRMIKTKEIDLAAAQAGMVLAKAVVNASGRTLAASGRALTDTLIEGLRALGITRLTVQFQEDEADAAADIEAARAERIAYLFRKAEGDPLRDALRRALEQYRSGGDQAC